MLMKLALARAALRRAGAGAPGLPPPPPPPRAGPGCPGRRTFAGAARGGGGRRGAGAGRGLASAEGGAGPALEAEGRSASCNRKGQLYGPGAGAGAYKKAEERVTLRTLRRKMRRGEPICAMTAYDHPSAVHVSDEKPPSPPRPPPSTFRRAAPRA